MAKLKKSTIIILAITLVLVLAGGFIAGFEITRTQEKDDFISFNGEHIRQVFASLDIDDDIVAQNSGTFVSGDFKARVHVSIEQGIGMGINMRTYFKNGAGIIYTDWMDYSEFSKNEYQYNGYIIYQQTNGAYMKIDMECNYPDKAQSEAFWNFVSQQIDKAIADASAQEVA